MWTRQRGHVLTWGLDGDLMDRPRGGWIVTDAEEQNVDVSSYSISLCVCILAVLSGGNVLKWWFAGWHIERVP